MNIRKHVEGLALEDGQSHRSNCPVCGSKGTFTAYADGGTVLYNCYKLGCSASGVVHKEMSARDIMMRLQRREKREEEEQSMEVPVTLVYDWKHHQKMVDFAAKWGLKRTQLLYDIQQQRAVFPIISASGRFVDAVGRTLKQAVPKWYRYTGKGDYYHNGRGSTAVVVEDAVSASVIGESFPGKAVGFAILGTQLTHKQVQALKAYDKVIVALDPDALSKTVAFTSQLRQSHKDVLALRLTDDVKYRDDNDMENLRKELT